MSMGGMNLRLWLRFLRGDLTKQLKGIQSAWRLGHVDPSGLEPLGGRECWKRQGAGSRELKTEKRRSIGNGESGGDMQG